MSDPERPLPPSDEPSWRVKLRAQGAAQERARIVAWLRVGFSDSEMDGYADYFAQAIEAGEVK